MIFQVYKTLCFSFEAFTAVKLIQQIAATSLLLSNMSDVLNLHEYLKFKSSIAFSPTKYFVGATVTISGHDSLILHL